MLWRLTYQSSEGRLGKFMKRNVFKIIEYKENTSFSERPLLPYFQPLEVQVVEALSDC